MVGAKEKEFKVRGTYRLVKRGGSKNYEAVDKHGHGVKLGTSSLKLAKKRAGLAIKKMEETK